MIVVWVYTHPLDNLRNFKQTKYLSSFEDVFDDLSHDK